MSSAHSNLSLEDGEGEKRTKREEKEKGKGREKKRKKERKRERMQKRGEAVIISDVDHALSAQQCSGRFGKRSTVFIHGKRFLANVVSADCATRSNITVVLMH